MDIFLRPLKFLTYLLFLGFSVLILGEILVRTLIPPDHKKHDRSYAHPYIRTEWVPGFEAQYQTEGIGDQKDKVNFRINEFGFRSASMKTAQKPAQTTRLFFLGESTTECITMPEEKTFPYLVQKKLSEAFPDKHFESINAGMSGNLAADSLATLIYKVLYYQPDIIIVMHGINDMRYGTVPTYDPINRTDFQRSFYFARFYENSVVEGRLKALLKKSHFILLLKSRLFDRFFKPSMLQEYDEIRAKRRALPASEIPDSKSLEDFLKYLQEIVFVGQGHKIRVILMTEPFIYQPNMPKEIDEKLWMGLIPGAKINLSNAFMLREMNRFNDAVRHLNDVEVIDLEKDIPKDLVHFYDDVHLTPEGSALAAEKISAYLISHPEKA